MKILDKIALKAYSVVLKRLKRENSELRKVNQRLLRENEAMKVNAKTALMALEGSDPDYMQAWQELYTLLKIDY